MSCRLHFALILMVFAKPPECVRSRSKDNPFPSYYMRKKVSHHFLCLLLLCCTSWKAISSAAAASTLHVSRCVRRAKERVVRSKRLQLSGISTAAHSCTQTSLILMKLYYLNCTRQSDVLGNSQMLLTDMYALKIRFHYSQGFTVQV